MHFQLMEELGGVNKLIQFAWNKRWGFFQTSIRQTMSTFFASAALNVLQM